MVHDASTIRARKRTWVTGCKAWLNRFGPDTQALAEASDPRALVLQTEWMGIEGTSGITTEYRRMALEGTRKVYLALGGNIALRRGTDMLLRCRTGTFYTGVRLAQCGRIPRRYLGICPMCEREGGETLAHMIRECPRWRPQRRRAAMFEGKTGSAAQGRGTLPETGPGGWESNTVEYLLGGEVRAEAANWKPLQERYRELGVVARFLQLIGPARAVKLSGLRWALSSPVTPPRVEAPRGMTPVVLPESVQVV